MFVDNNATSMSAALSSYTFFLLAYCIADKITFDAAREQYNANQIYLLQHKPHQTFFEPAFVICYGWKFLKFKYGNSRAINLTNKDLNISERSYFFGISLNGSFKVNKKVNAKK